MRSIEEKKQTLIPIVRPNYEENFLAPFRNDFISCLSYDVRIYILEWIMVFHELVISTPSLHYGDIHGIIQKFFGYFLDDPNRVPRLIYRSSHIRILPYLTGHSEVLDLNPLPLARMKNLLLYCSTLNENSLRKIHELLTTASKQDNGLKHIQLSSLSEPAFQNLISKHIGTEQEKLENRNSISSSFISNVTTFSAIMYFRNSKLVDEMVPLLHNTVALKLSFDDPSIELRDDTVKLINSLPKLKKLELPCLISSASIKYLLESGKMELLVLNMGLHVFHSYEIYSFSQNQNIRQLHCIQGSTEGLSALVAIAMRNTRLVSFSVECGRSKVVNFLQLLSHPTLKSLNLSRIGFEYLRFLSPPKEVNTVLENITIDANLITLHTIRLVSKLQALKRLSFIEITPQAPKIQFSFRTLLEILGDECASAPTLRSLSFELHNTAPVNHGPMSFTELMYLLSMFPSLEELHLPFCISSEDELEILFQTLPKLRCLTGVTVDDEEAFIALVKSHHMLYASVHTCLSKQVAAAVASYACYQLRVI